MVPLAAGGVRLILFFLAMSKAIDEDSDRLARWQAKWTENDLGWHQDAPHEALVNHAATVFRLGSDGSCPKPSRVLVPLCGKAVDMAHLVRQEFVSEVVGVDGVPKALEEFQQEQPQLQIQPTAAKGPYDRLAGHKITLLRGDFFGLNNADTDGRFDVVFDRGSMVAIEPYLREAYVDTISKLVAPGGRILLVAIERNTGTEEDKNGPPFSIPMEEVKRLYDQDWVESVTLLQGEGEMERNANRPMRSRFYCIQAK